MGRDSQWNPLLEFQSTLPGWGATDFHVHAVQASAISIHAPRMGSDLDTMDLYTNQERFQSTLPGWGATFRLDDTKLIQLFQSTLPGWGATCAQSTRRPTGLFQSTLPGWGATTYRDGLTTLQLIISIHAPRMGSDSRRHLSVELRDIFQSTLPGWGATWLAEPSAEFE